MISAARSRKNAAIIEVVWLSAVSSGTVHRVPNIPNPSKSGLLPILSDKAPKTGCRQAKRNRVIKDIKVDCSLLNCTVLTRNFCMYVVYV
ncbi:hypothetical protein D3C72_976100 [compost metagenome]